MNPTITRLLGLGAVVALFVLMVASFSSPRDAFSYAPEATIDSESAASVDWDTKFIPAVFRGTSTPPAATPPAAVAASSVARSQAASVSIAPPAASSVPSGTVSSVSYSAYASAGTTVSVGTTPPPPATITMPPAPAENSPEEWEQWRLEFEKRAEEWRDDNGGKNKGKKARGDDDERDDD